MLNKMKFEQISIMAAVMWEILAIIAGAILVFATLFIFTPFTWLWHLILFVIGLILIGVTFVYIPLLYVNTEFAINKKAIVYSKGVIFPSTQILYRERVVFVTVYNNPLTPLLKVSTLVISATGGTMRILFLNSKRAQEIANLLSNEKLVYGNEI